MYRQSLFSSPLRPTVVWTCGECILALTGALWKLLSTRDCSFVSDGACVCHLRYKSCEIADLAWLPSCGWWPPRLNIWTRRRLGPGPDSGSGVDIVRFLFVICDCVSVVLFDASLFLFILVLYMLLGCVFMSTLSLSAECPLCFPSVAIVFVFFGGGWFLPNRFFWLGCRFNVAVMSGRRRRRRNPLQEGI